MDYFELVCGQLALLVFPHLLDTESWHEIITLDKNMAADARNIGLSYTEDGFNAK